MDLISYEIKKNIFYLPTKGLVIIFKNNVNKIEKIRLMRDISKEYGNIFEMETLPKINEVKFRANYIVIFPTSNCNLKCVYCYYESGGENSIQLSEKQVDNILKKLVQNSILLSRGEERKRKMTLMIAGGGEPTYNKEFFYYIVERFKDLANKYNIEKELYLITNGIFDYDIAEYILNNFDGVQISYDGLPEIQNKNRPTLNCKNSNEIVEKNIEYFDKNKFKYHIRSTLLPRDFKKIPEIIDYCFTKFKNLSLINVEPVFNKGRAENMNILSYNNKLDFINSFEEAWKLIYKKNYKGIIKTHYLQAPSGKQYYCSSSIGKGYYLNEEGWIMSCSEKLPLSDYAIGFVDKLDIKYVKTSQQYFLPHEELINSCKACFAFFHCKGGCPMLIKKDKNGLIDEVSRASCELTRNFIERAIDNFLKKEKYCEYKAEEYKISDEKKGFIEKIIKVFIE
ncbi:radical SAM protein [Caldicellulosiruptoraceae bacterium PP1]